MGYIVTNLTAIVAATLVGLVLGGLYVALGGRSQAGNAGRGARWGLVLLALLAEFWLASILAGALILAPPGPSPWVMALGSAVVIWIGFVLPTQLVGYALRRQRAAATLGDALHWLAVMAAQAAVLKLIGLTHP